MSKSIHDADVLLGRLRPGSQPLSESELEFLRTAQDEFGNPLMRNPSYRAKFQAEYAKRYPGPNIETVKSSSGH